MMAEIKISLFHGRFLFDASEQPEGLLHEAGAGCKRCNSNEYLVIRMHARILSLAGWPNWSCGTRRREKYLSMGHSAVSRRG